MAPSFPATIPILGLTRERHIGQGHKRAALRSTQISVLYERRAEQVALELSYVSHSLVDQIFLRFVIKKAVCLYSIQQEK